MFSEFNEPIGHLRAALLCIERMNDIGLTGEWEYGANKLLGNWQKLAGDIDGAEKAYLFQLRCALQIQQHSGRGYDHILNALRKLVILYSWNEKDFSNGRARLVAAQLFTIEMGRSLGCENHIEVLRTMLHFDRAGVYAKPLKAAAEKRLALLKSVNALPYSDMPGSGPGPRKPDPRIHDWANNPNMENPMTFKETCAPYLK